MRKTWIKMQDNATNESYFKLCICFDRDFCFGNDTGTSYFDDEFIYCANETRAQNEQIMR